MKKSLIALAVAGAVAAPAAMADMTIGGDFAFGYQNIQEEGGSSNDSGWGTDTAAIKVTGTTELDNGVAVKGYISAGGMARGQTLTGENAGIEFSGDFGKVMMRTIEAGATIRAVATAGAPVNNMEGEVLSAASNIDILSYYAPAMGPVTLSAHRYDGAGLAVGEDKSGNIFRADVKSGMFTAQVDYTVWEDNASLDDRVRASGRVDLGMASFGAGVDQKNYTSGQEVDDMIVGASVKAGEALTLGAVYVEREDTTAGVTTDSEGWTVGAAYALSSNITVSANHAKWETNNGATDNDKTTFLVGYSF